jgi:modulator of FtsH protease
MAQNGSFLPNSRVSAAQQPFLRNGQMVVEAQSTPRLLAQVLGMVAIAFAVMAAGSYFALALPPGLSLLAMLGEFALLFAIRATRANSARQVPLFYLFALLMGVGLGPTMHHYLGHGGPQLIARAAGTTGLGLAMLGTFAYAVSIDWRKITAIASFFLIGLIVLSLVSIFFHFIQPTTMDWLVLAVFSVLTVGDFARVRAGGAGATAAELALSIFLDGANIFLAVLDIFGRRDD